MDRPGTWIEFSTRPTLPIRDVPDGDLDRVEPGRTSKELEKLMLPLLSTSNSAGRRCRLTGVPNRSTI